MKLLALDFDGVIADSACEAFAVAVRTYAALWPASRIAESAARQAGDAAPARERVESDPLYGGFLELMPLGNRAEDYGVALSALDAGQALADQGAYDAFRARVAADWLRSFHRSFYRVRAAMADADPARWQRLLAPYPGLIGMLRRRRGDAILAIATAKDRRSVSALLRAYGAEELFPSGRVLDKETGVSKRAHLEHLRRSEGVDYPEITFVDDKLNHLDSVAPLGVRCAIAAWGYNGPRELVAARARGYLVCRLEDAERLLFGPEAGAGRRV